MPTRTQARLSGGLLASRPDTRKINAATLAIAALALATLAPEGRADGRPDLTRMSLADLARPICGLRSRH